MVSFSLARQLSVALAIKLPEAVCDIVVGTNDGGVDAHSAAYDFWYLSN
jgi:hypothetical protein